MCVLNIEVKVNEAHTSWDKVKCSGDMTSAFKFTAW